MPSLQPGVAGAKEVYGIVLIRDDCSITIPDKALNRYGMEDNDILVMITSKASEPSFGLMRRNVALKNVFKHYVELIEEKQKVHWFNKKACTLVILKKNKIYLNEKILTAYKLKIGDKLLAIKSTTTTIGHVLADVFKKRLLDKGFYEAVENMEKLEIY